MLFGCVDGVSGLHGRESPQNFQRVSCPRSNLPSKHPRVQQTRLRTQALAEALAHYWFFDRTGAPPPPELAANRIAFLMALLDDSAGSGGGGGGGGDAAEAAGGSDKAAAQEALAEAFNEDLI